MLQQVNGFFLAIVCITGCAPARNMPGASRPTKAADSLPDYSNTAFWAAHPAKKDPSDSIPLPLLRHYTADTSADVFFLHPTTFTNRADSAWNAALDDGIINNKTDNSTILYQASAFNEYRIFAPRYRQANLRAYYTTDTAKALKAFGLAYQDLKTAFQYYLDHYNNGRPIIIASHSQGSTHAQRLLKDFFEYKPLANKLVVAYITGMRVPKNYYTGLPPCQDSLQTGCFVAWRTYKAGYEPDFVVKENDDCFVTNPLTWTTDNNYAARSLNEGGILLSFNKLARRVCDAQIHGGVLWVHRPHFTGSILYRSKNYHIGDINLFYMNIRNNVRARVGAYRKKASVHE
jgi:hypothetical protein